LASILVAEMKGQKMNKVLVTTAVLLGLSAAPSLAADLKMYTKAAPAVVVSPWDIAFGGAIMSDYNFRGISQSDRGPTASAYFEPRYNVNPNLQLYAGIAGAGVDLPQSPSAEIDLYAGFRPTFGAFAFDFGGIYYWYPKGDLILYPNGNVSLADQSYWEVYAKVAYTFNPTLTVGANLYYFDSWLNTGASGYYLSGTAKVTLPSVLPNGIGWYASGEFGHMALGTTDISLPVYATPISLPDYNTWNLGVGFTYKVFTLDLRYYDSDLTKGECNVLTGDPKAVFDATDATVGNNGNVSKWCNPSFVAKLSFDMTLDSLK
jgi:uncharacterized protein (TIGR02001 family)